jgi:Zn-dependent protease/CBS domain-containing protein
MDGEKIMFSKSIKLFRLFGFNIKMDLSWLILALLITWTLATGLFPAYYSNLSITTYWWMGVFGMLGLLVSIVFHELAHALVARRFNIPIRAITLFIFGGVAQMEKEPPNAKSELWMAIAGPIASALLGFIFFFITLFEIQTEWGQAVYGVLYYLGLVNIVLAGFNILPAFPLDGGRVLRAILWQWKNDLPKATRITSQIGTGFGVLLVVLGALSFISGNFIGGVWWFLIGMFMRSASQQSYRHVIMRKLLEGEPVEKFMKKDAVTVSPDMHIDEFVNDYIYKYHHKIYPAIRDSKLVGCVNLRNVKHVAKEEWATNSVKDIMESCNEKNTLDINSDAVKALSLMRKNQLSRILITDNSRLAGVISLRDLLEFLSLKIDLEDVN